MELRNYTRYYTYTKAFYKFNKLPGIKVTPRQLNVLFATYLQTKKQGSTTAKQVHLLMLKCGRGINSYHLYGELIELEKKGFVTSDNPGKWKVKKYSITFEGLQALQDFEQIHRNERLDK